VFLPFDEAARALLREGASCEQLLDRLPDKKRVLQWLFEFLRYSKYNPHF
jgi:hypothetical protein